VVVGEAETSHQIDPSQHVHEQERLRDFTREADGRVAGDDGAGGGPDERVDVEVEGGKGFDLIEETREEAELGFGATIFLSCTLALLSTVGLMCMCAYLRFIEGVSFDFLVEGLGYGSSLEDTVLTVEKPVLKGEFCE
jgi:hypothetical protein